MARGQLFSLLGTGPLTTGLWPLLAVQFRQTLLHGDSVNRKQGWVALIVLGLAFCTPTFLHAHTKTSRPANHHPEVPKQEQKSSKEYQKQMRKQQKQQAKWAKKQAKQNKKAHPTTHSVI